MRSASAVVAVVLCASLAGAVPALGHRAPSSSQRKLIDAAIRSYVRAKHSFAARDSRIVSISQSTANANYALVRMSSRSTGPARALVRHTTTRRRSHGHTVKVSHWKVADYGPGSFSCSDAPAKVFKDLFGSAGACAPAGY